LRLYSKLNSKPNPQLLDFQKKDDIGIPSQSKESKNIYYQIDYSPCDFNSDDILFLTLLGFEKKSNYNLKTILIHDSLIKVLCNKIPFNREEKPNSMNNNSTDLKDSNSINNKQSQEEIFPPEAFNFAAVFTDMGTIRYGGIYNKTVDSNLFLFNYANKWEIIKPKDKLIPEGRYGHNLFYYNNFVILFGGKNIEGKILDDLWIFDLQERIWIPIDYIFQSNEKENDNSNFDNSINNKFVIPKYLASGAVMNNLGKLIIYGGQNNFDDKNLYILNLKYLVNIVDYLVGKKLKKKNFKANFMNINSEQQHSEIVDLLKKLWDVKMIEAVTPRYGLSITQINNHQVMFFGGIDRNHNTISTLEILDLRSFQSSLIEPKNSKEFPTGRAYHQIQKIGPILILIGGENSNSEPYGEIWKFNLENFIWNKLEFNENFEIIIKRSNFYLTKVFENGNILERPVLYSGYSRNKEIRTDFIILNFEVCSSSLAILSKNICFPCAEGHIINDNGKCEACRIGYYQDFENNIFNKNLVWNDSKDEIQNEKNNADNQYLNNNDGHRRILNAENSLLSLNYYELYFNSKCLACPKKTYNNRIAMSLISSCKLCEFGFFNNLNGQGSCFECSKNEICLAGTEKPIKQLKINKSKNEIIEHINDLNLMDFILNEKIQEKNFPDFLDANSKTQFFTKLVGCLVLLIINLFLIVILSLFYCFRRKRTVVCLINSDFLPLTGGLKRKMNGGIITLIYIAIIISFTIFFIIRFCYFNQEIEVISLTHSIGDLNKKEFSIKIEVDLLGYEYNCINPEITLKNDFYECHPDIDFIKIENNNKVTKFKANDKKKSIMCKLGKENNICKVLIECKECESIKNEDQIEIYLKNPKSYIQAYNWALESYWSGDFIEENGFSKIYSSFHADKDNE